jgi:hypothetical protein
MNPHTLTHSQTAEVIRNTPVELLVSELGIRCGALVCFCCPFCETDDPQFKYHSPELNWQPTLNLPLCKGHRRKYLLDIAEEVFDEESEFNDEYTREQLTDFSNTQLERMIEECCPTILQDHYVEDGEVGESLMWIRQRRLEIRNRFLTYQAERRRQALIERARQGQSQPLSQAVQDQLATLDEPDENICCICMEEPKSIHGVNCLHEVCSGCYNNLIGLEQPCPICRRRLSEIDNGPVEEIIGVEDIPDEDSDEESEHIDPYGFVIHDEENQFITNSAPPGDDELNIVGRRWFGANSNNGQGVMYCLELDGMGLSRWTPMDWSTQLQRYLPNTNRTGRTAEQSSQLYHNIIQNTWDNFTQRPFAVDDYPYCCGCGVQNTREVRLHYLRLGISVGEVFRYHESDGYVLCPECYFKHIDEVGPLP